MDITKNKIICKHYGYDEQKAKAIEEMAELTIELVKPTSRENLKSELADVLNCLHNLCLICEIKVSDIEEVAEFKKDRQITRIKNNSKDEYYE